MEEKDAGEEGKGSGEISAVQASISADVIEQRCRIVQMSIHEIRYMYRDILSIRMARGYI